MGAGDTGTLDHHTRAEGTAIMRGKLFYSKPLAEFRPGSIVFTSERIDDETRETFYIRDANDVCRYPYNVPIARIGLVQGDPTSNQPRVVRILNNPCRDPGEADGRTPCRPIHQSTFYPLVFK